ncbi:alpha/beta hydrolase [Fictibacillus sp. NPDC058756]|uniref:alpha/beta hydrolase n=1 Tax=Fictibacillus sp. NPDC058756 TaxID=3346625 RepID=UPI0036C83A1C
MTKPECFTWRGKVLAHTIHYPSLQAVEEGAYPLIIICHGFTSTRIGVDRLFVKTAKALVKQGYAVLRFDYAGCGESEGEYGENGFYCLIDQTQAAISFGRSLPCINSESVTLIGHSLGGAVAVCTGAIDNRIGNIILWSAVGRPYEDITTIVGYNNQLDNVIDHLGYAITDDFISSLKPFSPIDDLYKYNGNVLFIHGTGDIVIDAVYCSEYYYHAKKRIKGSAEMVLIEAASHTFSTIPHFKQLISATSLWLSKYVPADVNPTLKKSV